MFIARLDITANTFLQVVHVHYTRSCHTSLFLFLLNFLSSSSLLRWLKMSHNRLRHRIWHFTLSQNLLQQLGRLWIHRLFHSWVDALSPLVVEGEASAKLVAIDLRQCWDGRH